MSGKRKDERLWGEGISKINILFVSREATRQADAGRQLRYKLAHTSYIDRHSHMYRPGHKFHGGRHTASTIGCLR